MKYQTSTNEYILCSIKHCMSFYRYTNKLSDKERFNFCSKHYWDVMNKDKWECNVD